MKKIFFLIILIIPFQTLADARDFQIEGMRIGDDAINYYLDVDNEDKHDDELEDY